MSTKTQWTNSKGLYKEFNGLRVCLGKAFDLTHGYGWHCQVLNKYGSIGYSFDKKSRFKAVRGAICNLHQYGV